jgi:ADP-ribose pyrophosphatase YjhB (NUDIX family)
MNREQLIRDLNDYQARIDPREARLRERILRFVERHENCASRSLRRGHLTGSAWVVDPSLRQTLLTHHRRLEMWVQPGGHVEEDGDMREAAWREAREESGLSSVTSPLASIFDVDVHVIPGRKTEVRHLHYDIRYLFVADPAEPLTATWESRELRWVELEKIGELTEEESIARMVRKTIALRSLK